MILARYSLAAPSNGSSLKFSGLRILLLSALGVSALCGVAVFLFLLAGEQRAPIPASNSPAASSPVPIARPSYEANSASGDAATATESSKAAPVEFEKAEFLLVKSQPYQVAGPLRIRLLRTSRKKCDIAVSVNAKRARRLSVIVGKAVDISMPSPLPHATLVVNRVAGDRAWGYLISPKSPVRKSTLFYSHRRSR